MPVDGNGPHVFYLYPPVYALVKPRASVPFLSAHGLSVSVSLEVSPWF